MRQEKILKNLSSHEIDTEQTLKEIEESINIENAGKQVNLFKRPYRRIVFIGIFVGIFSQLTGIGVVFYYSAQIFSIAGFSRDTSMLQSVILGLTNLIFTLIAMSVIDKVGRKKLLLVRSAGNGNCSWIVRVRIAYRKYQRFLVSCTACCLYCILCFIDGSGYLGDACLKCFRILSGQGVHPLDLLPTGE